MVLPFTDASFALSRAPAQVSPHESRRFARYLHQTHLMVELWDVDSILPIGTLLVDLRRLMRQQAGAVTSARLCDVVSHYDASPARLGGDVVRLGSGDGTLPAGRIVAQVEVLTSCVGRRGLVDHDAAAGSGSGGGHGVLSVGGSVGRMLATSAASARRVSGPGAATSTSSLRRSRTKVTAQHLADADPSAARALRMRASGAALAAAAATTTVTATTAGSSADPFGVVTRREMQLLREKFDRDDDGRIRCARVRMCRK